MEDEQVDWHSRYKTLEGQLDKFRDQASKVRDAINQKVCDLSRQKVNAERSAVEANVKVKELESVIVVKEERAKQLQEELEKEKVLRLQHTKQVEDKTAKIKEWMQNKISEFDTQMKKLTSQNEELRFSNDELTIENEKLRSTTSHLRLTNERAVDIIKDLETKLKFSYDEYLRTSVDLTDNERSEKRDSLENDYYQLEPPDECDRSESVISNKTEHSEIIVTVNGNKMPPLADSPPVSPMSISETHSIPMAPDTLNLDIVPDSELMNQEPAGDVFPEVDKNQNKIQHVPDSPGSEDKPADIMIKRTSSGKSPSKIPRYVGTKQSGTKGQVSYYMSLKRSEELASKENSKAKFYIQVQNSSSAYMHLLPKFGRSPPSVLSKKAVSETSLLSTGDRDSVFSDTTYLVPGDVVDVKLDVKAVEDKDGRISRENRLSRGTLTGSLLSLDSHLEPDTVINTLFETLKHYNEEDWPEESTTVENSSNPTPVCTATVTSATTTTSCQLENDKTYSPPLSPPPLPSRLYQPEDLHSPPPTTPPTAPHPPPSLFRQPRPDPEFEESIDVTRMNGGFTSYIPGEGGHQDLERTSSEVSLVSRPIQHQWDYGLWNDITGTDSPPYSTLENTTKEINLLKEQTCPVYATLKGRASQLRNMPFSGDSTDSSDDENSRTRDYCMPPDSISNIDGDQSGTGSRKGSSEMNKKVLKTCATYTTVSLKKGDQRKQGYLTKLGGRIKNWKKRWFVLHDSKLFYYKSQHDVSRKPLGQVPLDGSCRIARTEGALTFEVSTPKRTYYLTGESSEVVDEWLRVLHSVLRKFSTSPLLAQAEEKEVQKGWLTRDVLSASTVNRQGVNVGTMMLDTARNKREQAMQQLKAVGEKRKPLDTKTHKLLQQVRRGVSKRCWCVLRGTLLYYYKNEDDQVPFSVSNLLEYVVEEVETRDSEDDIDSSAPAYHHYCLVLKTTKQPNSTYLLVESKEEKDSWLFHMTVASGGGMSDMGTDLEKHITRLMRVDGDPESELWNSSSVTYTKDPISHPLTTLPSKNLENEAVQMFKSIRLFTTVATDEGKAIDYHVSLAQNAMQTCINHPELQNEVICQLIKQTSKQIHKGPQDLGNFLEHRGKSSWLRGDSISSATSNDGTIDLRPVQEYVYIQAWQLLALCLSLFVPKNNFLWYLRAHLQRCRNAKSRLGKYAAFCQRCLERTLENGRREARPSRMEVLCVFLRNPYDHSSHMSIPVNFIDGASRVFGFDASTTVQEFTETINREMGIRDVGESGFAIFTDNPVTPVEHCLQTSVKLCDVISKWEQALRSLGQGKFDPNRAIKLTYKNRLYFKSLSDTETEKEKYFLVHQTHYMVVKGRHPVSRDMAIGLAALIAQIKYRDYKAHTNSLPSKRIELVIDKHYPKKMRDGTEIEKRSLILKLAGKWSTYHGWSEKECVEQYLKNTRHWPFFGCKLFKGMRDTVSSAKKPNAATDTAQPVWLAVDESSIGILEGETLRLMCRYKYKHVVTFGGFKDDFMLVVNQSIMRGGHSVEQGTQRLLFAMPRGKILELTLLMASYINAIVRLKGITCEAGTTIANKALMDLKVWDLESAEWPIVPGSKVGLV